VVVDVQEDAGGFTAMLGGLLQANLRADPGKADLVRRTTGSVVVEVTDTGEQVRLVLAGGRLAVRRADERPADLRLAGTADVLMALTTTPLRFGLPDVLSGAGRVAAGRWVGGGLEVHGLPRAAPLLRAVLSLLSVVS
jgi:hypothetical protein